MNNFLPLTPPLRIEDSLPRLPSYIPAPPPGKKWRHTAMLVDESDYTLSHNEYIYDPRIPSNLSEEYPEMLHHDWNDPQHALAENLRLGYKLLLRKEGFENLVKDAGVARIEDPAHLPRRAHSPPVVFAVVMHEKDIGEWRKLDALTHGYLKEMLTNRDKLELSSKDCPQFALPVRFYWGRDRSNFGAWVPLLPPGLDSATSQFTNPMYGPWEHDESGDW